VHRVFIIPDNDEAGQAHAQVVGQSVRAANIAVTLLPLPDLPPHGDVSDWLLNGGSKEALQALMAAKPYALPTGQTPAPVAPPALPTDAQTVTQYHLTDLGMAESLRDRYADRLRYDHQREQWLIWDGHFWRPDPDEGAFRTAYDHVRLFQRDATFVPDFLERKKYLDFGLAREKRGPLVAMLQQAAALKPLAVAGDDWDADPMLLGCPNGVVDLRTGTRRDGTREDRITLQAGVPYEHAECPRWWQFLSEVFEGDVELIDYLWRAIGYSLTGDMREQCFFVAYGAGSNGKSLLLDTLETVFGTYGHRADMRMFAGTGQESNSFANADFRGKRLIFAAEVRPNSRMNEHVIKHLTGGESLRAEYKYGRSFTIRPVGKIWLGVNHRPKVTDDSFGFWRRVRLIPFLRTFTGAAEDRRLRDKLRAEAPGILAWAIQGCLEWQARGLVVPAVVQEATQEYRQGEDPLADFFASRVVTGPEATDAVVLVPTLYAAYREWATVQGIGDREKISARSFGALLRARGFEKVSMGGVMAFRGLTLEPKP
jgi:putative DNA primase/helicase